MSEHSTQECVEEFLRKSLLGEELVNTQFHLFSAKSSPSRRVFNPRVLCANNVLLAKSSKFFLDLLSLDTNPSDPSLIDLADDNDVPSHAQMDEYGYESDSDLDDCNDSIPEASRDQSAMPSTTPSQFDSVIRSKGDDELTDDGSVSSDMFVMSPEHPSADRPYLKKDRVGSVASSETAVQNTSSKISTNKTAPRFFGGRHVLVKDTAFLTWYTLLNYLYTDKFSFLPLGSATPNGQVPESPLTDPLDEPRCSAKSMYRLACKVGLDLLRDEAFAYIRSNLTEHNILKELSCSLLSRHPELLEMELDVLYSHIASPPIVANFPALAQRIANRELSHGADIIIGIHTRLLKACHPVPSKQVSPTSLASLLVPLKPPELPACEDEGEATPYHGDEKDVGSPSLTTLMSTKTVPSFTMTSPAMPNANSKKLGKKGKGGPWGKNGAGKPRPVTPQAEESKEVAKEAAPTDVGWELPPESSQSES